MMNLNPSIEHFIPPPTACLLADLCNHTWVPECGKENNHTDVQTFLDECHRHEYNCDNNKDYEKIEIEECELNTTTTSTTSIFTTYSTESMTTSTTTTTTNPATTTITTITTTIEPPETITSTASTITVSVKHNCSRPPPPQFKNCSSTTNNTENTINTITSTTESTTPSTTALASKPLNSTTKHVTTTNTTNDVYFARDNSVNITTATEELKDDAKMLDINQNTIPQNSAASTPVGNRKVCPLNGCNLPFTWETTAKGEVRDFFQIIKEKYGVNNVKLLRATTNWPRRIGWTKSYNSFIFGRHIDSGGNVIY